MFAGFSAESLSQRIVDCKPKVVITCNAVKRGSKVINLKDIVDAALVESSGNGVSVGMDLPIFACDLMYKLSLLVVFSYLCALIR